MASSQHMCWFLGRVQGMSQCGCPAPINCRWPTALCDTLPSERFQVNVSIVQGAVILTPEFNRALDVV
jgi:hypothetical protein